MLVLSSFFSLDAQEPYYKSKLAIQINPMFGFNGTFNSIKQGEFADELIEFKENEFYIEYLSLTGYVYKNWGISFRLQHILRAREEDYRFSFSNSMVERFNSDYFLPNQFNPEFIEGNTGIMSDYTPKVYLGLTKRLISTNTKFEFYPSIYVGYSQIELLSYKAIFKQRNTNRIMAYSITNNYGENAVVDNIELAIGLRFGYRVKEYLLIQTHLQYAYSPLNLKYVEEELDLYTKQKRIHTFEYPNAIHAYSLGIGVIFEFNNL